MCLFGVFATPNRGLSVNPVMTSGQGEKMGSEESFPDDVQKKTSAKNFGPFRGDLRAQVDMPVEDRDTTRMQADVNLPSKDRSAGQDSTSGSGVAQLPVPGEVKALDSVSTAADSIPADSVLLAPSAAGGASIPHVRDSTRKQFLDAPIFGSSDDSLVYKVKSKDIYSYRNSEIKYKDMELRNADFVKLNTMTKIVAARGRHDTIAETGELEYSRPIFKEKNQDYDMDSILYNMDTEKAIIHNVNTKEGEGIISGGVIKKMPDNVIHMHNGTYTTCDATCPHFYLQLTKGSVVPGKKTVFGPAYLVFEDVPIYFLGLPFGFFPQKKDRSSGFIVPEIGEEVVKGFFLRDGGYYMVLGDNVDITALGGIYTLGSWEGSLTSNYTKRYKFNGSISFDYAKNIIGEKGAANYDNTGNMSIMWTHKQDPKANPTSNFAASVNYKTSTYSKYNATNMNDYLNSQATSTVSYSKNWAGKPFSLSMNASMSQNARDTSFALDFPSVNFNVQRISPFKRKIRVGKEKWYEKISLTYNGEFRNSVKAKEEELFKPEMFDKMNMGVMHTIPVSASFNLLKYLNITPSVNYRERWYFRKVEKEYDQDLEKVVSDTTRGFYRVYDYNMSFSGTTKLYGTYTFGREKPVYLRHVMSPTASFSFTPSFDKYHELIQQTDSTAGYYSPYSEERYGVPGRAKSANLNFGIANTLEMKLPSDKDTTGYRKVKILESFNITSSYNFLADSLNLASFSINARATIIKGLSINLSATADPYQIGIRGYDRNGAPLYAKINKFQMSKGSLARLTALSFSFSYGFQSPASRNNTRQSAVNNPKNNSNNRTQSEIDQDNFFNQNKGLQQVDQARLLASQYYDFEIPWSVSTSYSFNYSKPLDKSNIQQTVNFNGSATITPKWGVSFGAGYDFKMKKLTPGTVQVTRDLHCFQLNFNWVPVGFRQSWSFTIRAKSSMLADLLKWKKTRSFIDNYYGF